MSDQCVLAMLEVCAADRVRRGLPSFERSDLERLFRVLDAPVPVAELPPNVIPFAPRTRPRRRARR